MPRSTPKNVRTVTCLGAGTIGGGWAAGFLAAGFDVIVQDPTRDAELRLRRQMDQAWPMLEGLGLAAGAARERLRFTSSLAEALASTDFVQESVPEQLDLKVALYRQLDDLLDPDVVVASSTSGFPMSHIQAECRTAARTVVGHPFNPPYLMPLVEIVGGQATLPETLDWTEAFYRRCGKTVLRMDKDVFGFVCNRLQIALIREAFFLVANEYATVAQIDDCLTAALGLRWAGMGPFATFHLAFGENGLGPLIDHYGDALLDENYVNTGPQPPITPALRDKITAQFAEVLQGRSIPQMIAERNALIVGVLQLQRDLAAKFPRREA